VWNASNIINFRDNYEKEISHFDIYDRINWENINNKSKDILIGEGPTR